MRALSLVLACVFILADLPATPAQDVALPGIGTFSYSGSSLGTQAQESMMVASVR